MRLMTKIKMFLGVVTLMAAAALAYNVFDPGLGMDRRDGVWIGLHADAHHGASLAVVTWQTSSTLPASKPIEGQTWNESLIVKQGDTVMMSVSRNSSGNIRCWITRGGDVVSGPKEETPPGTIGCQYVVL